MLSALVWLAALVLRGPCDSSSSSESNGRAEVEEVCGSGESVYLEELRMMWSCTRLVVEPERDLCGLLWEDVELER